MCCNALHVVFVFLRFVDFWLLLFLTVVAVTVVSVVVVIVSFSDALTFLSSLVFGFILCVRIQSCNEVLGVHCSERIKFDSVNLLFNFILVRSGP